MYTEPQALVGREPTEEAEMSFTVESIDPAKTALVVVDMQNDFVAPGALL